MTATTTEERLRRIKGWKTYVDAKLGFRNHWYPVLQAQSLPERTPTPVKLLGEKLLLNRIGDKIYCMRDRCMHRGVQLSVKPECLTKDTITCWYHGWTYAWETGSLVTILSNPQSSQIGRHNLKVYQVQEAKGLVFVFLGDVAPPPLSTDVPPNFLDDDLEICSAIQTIKSNWRVGVENGFDSGHIWIHKHSRLVTANDLALPLGFAPPEGIPTTRVGDAPGGPRGIYDLLGERSMPVFEAYIDDVKVAEGNFGETRVANEISIWLPGVLKVDPWPQHGMIQFEWYVPVDATSHLYVQTLARKVASDADRAAYRQEFVDKWAQLAFHDFNDDDVWAREASEEFYANDLGWLEERLYEPDIAIVEWRKFASTHNRGVQTPEDFYR